MKSLTQAGTLKGKTVLVRVDWNVPIKNGKVVDANRIEKSLKTLTYLISKKAKVITISHIGEDGALSLKPVISVVKKTIPAVKFVQTLLGEDAISARENMKDGDLLVLENLRSDDGEKANDLKFAKLLAEDVDLYVNDAFSVSHRNHASIVRLPKILPAYSGFQLQKEVAELNTVVKNNKHPFLFLLGGAKFETKLPLLKTYLKKADTVFLGGALANTALKNAGFEVGVSLVEEPKVSWSSILSNIGTVLPIDVVVRDKGGVVTKTLAEILPTDFIADIGPQTTNLLIETAQKAKLVVWNGPFGLYEEGFTKSSMALLKALAGMKTTVILGGGDTGALVSKLKLESKFTFVSTGGGATLEYLAKGTLPGIKALG